MKLGIGWGVVSLLAASLCGQEFKVGSKVGDFTVESLGGASVDFASLKGAVTVVTFISAQCPVSNSYNDRMKALYSDYTPKRVKFVFLNANSTEPPEMVAQHAREHGFPFQVYKDPDNGVADRFGASVTPEAYVIDQDGTLRYHGSIDDSMQPARITQQRLRGALDAVLAHQAVAASETKAFGCSIKRSRKAS